MRGNLTECRRPGVGEPRFDLELRKVLFNRVVEVQFPSIAQLHQHQSSKCLCHGPNPVDRLRIGEDLFLEISVTKAFSQQNILIVDDDDGHAGNLSFQPSTLSIGLDLVKDGAEFRIILVQRYGKLSKHRRVEQKKEDDSECKTRV